MLKSAFWSFLEQGGSKAVGIVVQVVLARLLLPSDFGVMAIVLVVVGIAGDLAQGGLGAALIEKQDVAESDCDTALWLSMALSALLYIAVFAIAAPISSFYGMEDLTWYIRAVAILLPINAFGSIQRSLLQKSMDFKSVFKANISAAISSGAVGVGLALAGAGIWALVAQMVVQSAVACAVMFAYVPWRPRARFDGGAAKGLYSYGWKVCATSLLGGIANNVSELIVGRACSPSDLGFYSQGRKWPTSVMSVVTNSLQNVFFPAFAEMRHDAEKLRAAISRTLAAGSYVLVGFSFMSAAIAEPFVGLLFGERWLGCVFVFQMACLSASPTILQLVNLRAYMALGESGLFLRLQARKVALLAALVWTTAILARSIDLIAAVLSATTFLSVFAVDLPPAKRMHGLGGLQQLAVFSPIFAAGVAAGLLAWTLTLTSLAYPAMLAAQIAVFMVAYLAESFLFHLPGSADALMLARRVLGRARGE